MWVIFLIVALLSHGALYTNAIAIYGHLPLSIDQYYSSRAQYANVLLTIV